MPITFERPVGPRRDVHELEFISALMQTDLKTIRLDGSIKAYDIVQYLKSRHGIDASEEAVRRLIVRDLAASTESDELQEEVEEIVLDICQFASLMLVPEFLEAKSNQELEVTMFGSVLNEMLSQAHGGVDLNNYDNNTLMWTPMALRHLLNRYNELDVSDELIHEMIKVAEGSGEQGGGDARECIIRALTSDLSKFDINWKNQLSINYYDALGGREANKVLDMEDEDDDDNNKNKMMASDPENVMTSQSIRRTATTDTASGTTEQEQAPHATGQQHKKRQHPLKRSYTAPNIDFYADTHRRPFFVTAIWVCCVCLYFAYVWGTGAEGEDSWSTLDCTNRSELSCPIINGITKFLAVFIQLTVLGVPFIFLGTLGASVYVQHWLGTVARMVVGMITIIIMAIMPFYRTYKSKLYDSSGNKEGGTEKGTFYGPAFYISVFLGFYLLTSRAVDLLFIFLPKHWLAREGIMQKLITPGNIQAESRMKRGASYKAVEMVNNALSCRPGNYNTNDSSSRRSTSRRASASSHTSSSPTEKALMNYNLSLSVKEQVGGVFWAWKRIFTGKIYSEEGIWLHGRLWTCNMAQFVVVFFVLFFASKGYEQAKMFDLNNSTPSPSPTLEPVAPVISAVQAALEDLPKSVANQTLNFTEALDDLMEYQEYYGFSDTVLYVYGMDIFNETISNLRNVNTSIGNLNTSSFQLNETLATIMSMNVSSTQIAALSGVAFLFYYQDILQTSLTLGTAFALLEEMSTNFNLDEFAYDNFQTGLLAAYTMNQMGDLSWVAEDELAPTMAPMEGDDSMASLFSIGTAVEMAESMGYTKADYILTVTVTFLCAVGAAGYVALSYVPSYVSQVLKFRSGVIPSLDDRDFLQNRFALDTIAVLFGSSFWSCLFSALAAGGIFGAIMALCLVDWGGTMGASIGGLIIGFTIVMITKTVVLIVCRALFFEALYRKRPAGANFMGLMVEVWNIALSVGIVSIRVLKILMISTFFIARLDTEFLAPGVGRVGNMELDSYPRVFRKDLVVHEAHRHVFIERFGLLCLLKLRHKEDFGSRANACWRLLYTLTLFPWLRKYRVGFLVNEDDEDKNNDIEDNLKSSNQSQQETNAMPSGSMRSSGDSAGLLQEIDALKSRNRQLEAALADLQDKRDAARRGSSRRATNNSETWEDEHPVVSSAPTSGGAHFGVPTDAELSRIGWAKALDTRRNKWYYYNRHQKQWNNPLE